MNKLSTFLLIVFSVFSCNQENKKTGNTLIGVELDDLRTALENGVGPIENTEFFKASGLKDSVYETESGMVMVVPKGAFLDEDGKPVEEEVVIELAEVKTLEDFMRAKLSELDDSVANQSERMVYINATSNGEQLTINQDSPVYLEFPVESKADLMVLEGVRDKDGNIHWLNPKKPENFLVPINQSLIQYYPEGFEEAVEAILPFKGHEKITDELVDSIFLALSEYCDIGSKYYVTVNCYGDINDPLAWDEGRVACDTIYHENSEAFGDDTVWYFHEMAGDTVYGWMTDDVLCPCINTASVKTIQNKKFQNTFLATREFEERLQYIYKLGSQAVLDYYIKNINEDLWKCDEFAAKNIGEPKLRERFNNYASEKLTNVKDADVYSKGLAEFYNRKLDKLNNEIKKNRKDYMDAHEKMLEEAKKKEQEYKQILEKRLEYRMEKFGFKAEKTGWYNIERVQPHELPKFDLNIAVTNGAEMDRVYAYFFQENIQSMFAFQSADKVNFNQSVGVDTILLSSIGAKVDIYAVAYKGKQPYFAKTAFRLQKENNINLFLEKQTQQYINQKLRIDQRGYKKFNEIQVDLKYREFFEEVKKTIDEYFNDESKMYYLVKYIDACWEE